MEINITPKDESLMDDQKVREYFKHIDKVLLKSLDVYQAVNKIIEANALGIPYSFEFNKETGMIDVILHKP